MSRLSRWMCRCLSLLAVAALIVALGCQESPRPKPKLPPKPAVAAKAPESKPAAKAEAKPEEKKGEEAKPEEKKEEKKEEAKEEKKELEEKAEKKKPEEPKAEEKKEEKKAEAKEEKKPEAKEEKESAEAKPAKAEQPQVPEAKPLKKPELLVELPDHCNTPDGMCVLPDGSVIVSVPNFNDKKAPPLLVKITKDNEVEDFLKLPPHPETKRMGPMGIRPAPNGDLYLADNQLFHHRDGKTSLYGKSRLVRIKMKDGKPDGLVVVANGINVANAVAIHDGYVYLTETILVPDSKPLKSGVFRFKLDEQDVQMQTPLHKDPHLILTLESTNPIPFGADGICFDKEGNLYVNLFADAVIRKIRLDKEGKVLSNVIFAKAPFMKSCDGMDYDPRTNKIYVADLLGNAVHAVSMEGKVQTLAANGDTDGSDGQLDAPCEALVRGNTIVVANMDFVVEGASVNTKFDKPYTISVIKLD